VANLVCGIGDWNGPKAGDPSNNVTLGTSTVLGGIYLSWNYPTVNPHAVAHTLVYRGTNGTFGSAIKIAVAAGSGYFDRITVTTDTTYYYWIQIVSINGTTLTPIGPVTGVAIPPAATLSNDLNQQINSSLLSEELRTDIGNIELLGHSLTQEIKDRLAANLALGNTITGVDGRVHNALAFIEQETNQRITGDGALATRLDVMGVGFDTAMAGIADQFIVKATETEALAKKITTVEATLNGNTATGEIGLKAIVSNNANSMTDLSNALGDVTDDVTKASNDIKGINTKLASVYTVKLKTVNQATGKTLFGGFGLVNDGTTVDAGFNVNNFWIGDVNSVVKPFVVGKDPNTNVDTVFIDTAVIKDLSVTTAKIGKNSITIPTSGYNVCYLDMPSDGKVFVVATANMYENSGSDGGGLNSAYSIQLDCPTNGESGGFMWVHGAKARWSVATTSFTFTVPKGSHTFQISYQNWGGNFSLSNAAMIAIAVLR